MRAWIRMLGGLVIWAAHFFFLYGSSSLFPGTATARWLTVGATAAALVAVALLLRGSLAQYRHAGSDRLRRWMTGVSVGGCGVAAVGIVYQSLPALLH